MLEDILSSFAGDRKDLVPLLQEVQARLGYLAEPALLEIAAFLHIPESAVYSVATFYNQFRFTPLGKHPIKVCMGTACHVQGGALVLEAVERELEVKVGGITPDGKFSVDRVACIGCCVLAPVMLVGETPYPRLTAARVEEALANLRSAGNEQA